jgi:uncharacterized surface protein with fasciclin (FAS1) repeats
MKISAPFGRAVQTTLRSWPYLTSNQIVLHYSQFTHPDGARHEFALELIMLKSFVFGTLAALLVTVASPLRAQTGDIVDTAVASGSFKTLAKALEAADLIGTLKGPGPFTVFAPTDDAFAKLPAGTVENLLKPENKAKLVRLLTYHVVSGKVMAAQAAKMTSAKAVSGDMLTISAAGGTVMIDQAKVAKADIAASNGVIHVIDSVIMPKGL